MNYVLLILATVCSSLKAIICKGIGENNDRVRSVTFLNANMFAISAITILICYANKIKSFFEISSFSFVLAIIFAVFLLFTQITQIFAMSRGFASLSSLIYSCGFLIPIFFSAIFLNECISVFQIIGIVILIFSLTVILPPERNGKFSFVWLTFALLSMMGSGANAVIQKIHQNSNFKAELAPFIFYAFLFASVFSLILSITVRNDTDVKNVSFYKKKSAVLLMIFGGAVIGILNVMNLKLAGQLPAIIQFPVYNICSMILTALAGRLFFKEQIGKRKLIGFIIGLLAITIIGLL